MRATESPEWLDDERFQSAELRDLNINDRLELVQGALIQKTTQVWLELLEANNVPGTGSNSQCADRASPDSG